jgi:hypothetical protein
MSDGKAPEPTEADIQRAAIATAREVYSASDGRLTVAFYRRLCARGTIGAIAMNLMRAQKTSSRAKAYRGRQYRNASYDTKNYSLVQLCSALSADPCGLVWGWENDDATPGFPWVLYVDLPTGQVSFHSSDRGMGPIYLRPWDGVRGASEDRILAFCDSILKGDQQ